MSVSIHNLMSFRCSLSEAYGQSCWTLIIARKPCILISSGWRVQWKGWQAVCILWKKIFCNGNVCFAVCSGLFQFASYLFDCIARDKTNLIVRPSVRPSLSLSLSISLSLSLSLSLLSTLVCWVLFIRLFDLCLFGFVGFLFLLGSRKGCGLWLWHSLDSLDFSLTFFLNAA